MTPDPCAFQPRRESISAESAAVAPRETLGLPGLDAYLGGGILSGSSLLLLGPAGSGKTFFAIQFLLEGMARGGRGLFLHLGSASPLRLRGLPFSEPLARFEREARLRALSSPLSATAFEPLRKLLEEWNPGPGCRVAIEVAASSDSLSLEERAFVADLQRAIQSSGATSLTTNRYVPESWDRLGTAAEMAPSSDGILLLTLERGSQSLERGLAILNLVGIAHESVVHPLSLDGDGLKIRSTPPPALSASKRSALLGYGPFLDAQERKAHLAALRRLLKRRFLPETLPTMPPRGVSRAEALTELNAPATDFALLQVPDSLIPLLARQGLIQPLDRTLPDAPRRFLPTCLERCRLDGRLYGAPLRFSARLLFSRTDLLRKHGFKAPRTWDELEETALEIARAEAPSNLRGLSLHLPQEEWFGFVLDMIQASGEELCPGPEHRRIQQAAVASALDRLRRLLIDPLLSGPGTLAAGPWDAVEDFRAGRTAFLVHSTDAFRPLAADGRPGGGAWDWGPLPTHEGRHRLLEGSALVIPARTRHTQAAHDCLAILMEPEAQLALDQASGWPFPAGLEPYLDARSLELHPCYTFAATILKSGTNPEAELPLRGSPGEWSALASESLASFLRTPERSVASDTAEEFTRRLGAFLPAPEFTDLVARALEAIHRDLARPLNIASLAGELGVTRSHLIRQFKGAGLASPLRTLNQARVDRAKELLRTTHLSVGEVGQKVGYKSIFHFSKIFRQLTGRSPSELRRFRYRPPS
jgi:AraC-like DNA-binding protein